MKSRVEKEFLKLFEKKGKYKSMVSVSAFTSILFLITDIMLCVVSFPYVRTIFNMSILFSLFSIIIYIIYDYKLEAVQKYILYLEDRSILNTRNIKRCLNEKERIKLSREIERYSSLNEEYKLINRISFDTLLRLRESLEMNNGI